MNTTTELPEGLKVFEIEGDIVAALTENHAVDHYSRETGIPVTDLNPEDCGEVEMDYRVHTGETADSPLVTCREACLMHVREGGTFPTTIAFTDA